jgi:hypothetical protein
MTLKPVGIKRLGSRLKSRRLQRVAYVSIPDMKGALFDYGDLRVWNAALKPDERNLVPEINKVFDFRIDNFFKLPKDIFLVLKLIELMFKATRDFKTGRVVLTVKIGKELCVSHGPHVTSSSLAVI